jgi:hypothetical protein
MRNDPEHQRQHHTQNQTRDDGEVKLHVLAFVGDVTRRLPRPKNENFAQAIRSKPATTSATPTITRNLPSWKGIS